MAELPRRPDSPAPPWCQSVCCTSPNFVLPFASSSPNRHITERRQSRTIVAHVFAAISRCFDKVATNICRALLDVLVPRIQNRYKTGNFINTGNRNSLFQNKAILAHEMPRYVKLPKLPKRALHVFLRDLRAISSSDRRSHQHCQGHGGGKTAISRIESGYKTGNLTNIGIKQVD